MSLTPKNPAVERWNNVIFGARGGGFFSPLLLFWGAALGPLRPFSYGPVEEKASLPWFLLGFTLSFAPLVFPRGYYRCREGARGARLYRALGVHHFKRFVTNGDFINRRGRLADPRHRLVRGAESARAWAANTDEGEKNHLVLLLMALFSALYAARLGWTGWALGLTASNVLFNLYPVLLQRYNRCRIERVLRAAP